MSKISTDIMNRELQCLEPVRSLEDLQAWVPQPPEAEQEIYPQYWSLRGWKSYLSL